MKAHRYRMNLAWTGNQGKGTLNYQAYSRNHLISGADKADDIRGSSDPSFLGDPTRYNPEELLVSSLSSCHMLWYLHLCAVHHIIVTDYRDQAVGIMEEQSDGSGKFREVTLHPVVTITREDRMEQAMKLHQEAHRRCFIANSCNFPVRHDPKILIADN